MQSNLCSDPCTEVLRFPSRAEEDRRSTRRPGGDSGKTNQRSPELKPLPHPSRSKFRTPLTCFVHAQCYPRDVAVEKVVCACAEGDGPR